MCLVVNRSVFGCSWVLARWSTVMCWVAPGVNEGLSACVLGCPGMGAGYPASLC